MKTKSILMFVLCVLLVVVGKFTIKAQAASQDSEGKSTIIFPGGIIAIDPGKTALTFSITNIPNNKGLLWGITARAENKSGIGTFIESSKVSPSALLSVTLGYSGETETYLDMALKEKEEKILKERNQMLDHISKDMLSEQFKRFLIGIPEDDSIKLNKLREEYWWNHKVLKEKLLEYKCCADCIVQQAIDGILAEVNKLMSQLKEKENEWDKITEKRTDEEKKTWYERWVLYARFSAGAGKFKLYTPSENADFEDQFKDINYNGLSFQGGVNMEFRGSLLLGFAVGFQKRANNLLSTSMSKNEFTLTTTETSGNQKLVKEEKITAYSGDFREFDRIDIDSDIVYFVKMGKSHVMTPYGYFRLKIPLGDGNGHTEPSTMSVGIGANFFTDKGKHLGGLFLELPDIKKKQNDDRKLLNRFTLGITLKISLSKTNKWIPW